MSGRPTGREINPFDDLDGRVAEKNLRGKDPGQALNLLKNNSAYYGGDYLWMGPVAFVYYAPALLDYLASEEAEGDQEFGYNMISTFRLRVEQDGAKVAAAVPLMRGFCEAVANQFERLAFDEDEQRRFRNRVAELEKAIAGLGR